MDYTQHYNKLVKRAPKEKPLSYYTEGHHIVPKCMGGTNADGIAYLTPEEHYIAHLLLVKMYPGINSLVYAANMMTISKEDNKRVNNKKYGWLRKKHAIAVSESKKGMIVSAETKAKISEANKGRKLTPEQCAARKPRGTMSAEHRKAISDSRKGKTFKPRGPMSAKQRDAISKARKGQPSNNKGKKFTVEHRYKISLSNKITYANKLNKVIEK